MQSTLTSKAQITLPKELRRLLQLETGDKVAFVTQADGHVVVCKASPPSVAVLRGVLPKPPKPLSVEAMNETQLRLTSSANQVQSFGRRGASPIKLQWAKGNRPQRPGPGRQLIGIPHS